MLSTVVASVTARAVAEVEAGEPAPSYPRWWLTVTDEATGEPVGVVMRTAPFAPHPLFVMPMPDAAARQVAAALVERGEEVTGAERRAAGRPDPRRPSWPGAPAAGRGCTSTPGCTCSRSWSSRRWLRTAGPGSPYRRTSSWRSRGSGPSTPTRPSRRAGWRRTPRASSSTRTDDRRADRRGPDLAVGGRTRDAGQPGRVQRAELRRGPGRPGLHAGRAPRARVRERAHRPRLAAAAGLGHAGLPLHRPGEPDVEQDLRRDRLRARRGHGEPASITTRARA